MSPHSDCGGDAAAYVLGALDAHELTAYRRHLESCSVCQADVESLQQLANALPLTADQYTVPRRLRRSVISAVRAEADADARRHRAPRRSLASDMPWALVPRYRPGLVAGAVALVLLLAVALVGLHAGASRTPAVSAHPAYSAYLGSGEVIVDPGHGELVVRHLTRLGRNRTYEVWLERAGGKPEPTRVLFNVSAGGYGDVTVPDSLSGISRVLVTDEPANGSAHPTTPAVFGVKLS